MDEEFKNQEDGTLDIENQQSIELLEFSETVHELEPTAFDKDLYAKRMQEINTFMKVYLDVWHGKPYLWRFMDFILIISATSVSGS